MSIEETVGRKLLELERRAGAGSGVGAGGDGWVAPVISLFGERKQGVLGAFAQHDGPVVHVVQEGTTSSPEIKLIEQRGVADTRPRLEATNKATTLDWIRENLGKEMLPKFFIRNEQLVRIPWTNEELEFEGLGGADGLSEEELERRLRELGPARIRTMSATGLLDIVQTTLWPYTEKVVKEKENGRVVSVTHNRTHSMIAGDICRAAVEGSPEWGVPRIKEVSHTPVLREDGSVLKKAGYDSASEVLLLLEPELMTLKMPEVGKIPDEWVSWACDTLRYLVCDFPFETPGHRANYFAALLTPLMRLVVPPPYPMFLLNAHQRGSGKSLLAEVLTEIHGGLHRPPLMDDEEEVRKQITSILMTSTAPIVNFDNAVAVIRAGSLANLLTSRVWTDRPLGKSESVDCVNDRIWISTGNNIRIGGDLSRRCLWVSVDAGVARPELRTGFAEANLKEYVRANRGTLLAALLCVLGHWVQRGMPIDTGVRSDSYGQWAGAMKEILEGGGALALCAEGDFTGGGSGAEVEAGGTMLSDDEVELRGLVAVLVDTFGGAEWQVTDVRRKVEEMVGASSRALDDALPGTVRSAKDTWKALTRYLLRHEKTFTEDGYRLKKVRQDKTGTVWAIEVSSAGV